MAAIILTFGEIINPMECANLVLSPVPEVHSYIGKSIRFICLKPDEDMEVGWHSTLSSFTTSVFDLNVTLDAVISDASPNNSGVFCFGRYSSNPAKVYFSNISTILLQGRLPAVQLSINQSDPCTLLIYWDPPFTLPGVLISILGYNINITNILTNETQKTFVNETQVHVPLGYYTVSIAGVNPVGEGNISTIHVDPTHYSTDFSISDNVNVSRNGNKWTVWVIVENNVLCGQNMEDSLSVNIISQRNNTDIYSTSDITSTTVGNSTILSGTLSLPDDHHYWINVAIDIGNYTRMSGYINLSTFDVQDIKVLNVTNDEICLDIKYVPGSVATGCSVDLESPYGSISPIRNITFLTNSSCAYIGFDSLIISNGKNIILKGYDKVNDVIEDINGPAVEVNISVMITPTMTSAAVEGLETLGLILSSSRNSATVDTLVQIVTTTPLDTATVDVTTTTTSSVEVEISIFISIPVAIVVAILILLAIISLIVTMIYLAIHKTKKKTHHSDAPSSIEKEEMSQC